MPGGKWPGAAQDERLLKTAMVYHDWPLIPRIGTLLHVGRNTSFSLGEHFSAFIEDEVASGRYGSASDVVRSALRLLEDREIRLRALSQALIAGEQSGDATPFDFDEFVAPKRAEDRELVLTEVEGHLEISPATTPVRLVDHGGALVAVAEVDLPVLTAEQVRDAVEATRR